MSDPSPSTTRQKWTTIYQRWAVPAMLLIVLLCVAGLAVVFAGTNTAMRQLLSRWMQSVLTANISSVELYLEDVGREAERIARYASIRTAAINVLQKDVQEPSSDIATLESTILDRPNVLGWTVVNSQGDVVASNVAWMRDGSVELSPVDRERWEDGHGSLVLLKNEGDATQFDDVMLMLHPLHQGTDVVGAIGWVLDRHGRFSELMAISRSGASDETYAIDRNGRLLSESRFRHSNNVPTQSLTWMADQATRGSSGVNTIGYTNYNGTPVIGAWQWLPRYQIAMATEISIEEAYQPVRLLRQSLIGMLTLMSFLAIAAIVVAAWSRRTIHEVDPTPQATRRLGQYELMQLIGVGGMGSVYRGRHQFLRRDVAIKVLEGDRLSPRSIARFRREVQLTSTLRHPNTIAIFDYGHSDQDRTFYYVMEYVDGISLQQLIDLDGPQSPERTVHLLLQICGAIMEAHQAGLIHRDIKPANVLVSKQEGLYDQIKVLDFGLVKEIERSGDSTIDENMTRAESITGTPLYMAPETIRDATAANPLSDLYSIGAVGYALLTGKPTFEGQSAIDLCLKQLQSAPLRPEERLGRRLPKELQDLLMRCLAVSPMQRPQSVVELADELSRLPQSNRWNTSQSQSWWDDYLRREGTELQVVTDKPTWVDQPLQVT